MLPQVPDQLGVGEATDAARVWLSMDEVVQRLVVASRAAGTLLAAAAEPVAMRVQALVTLKVTGALRTRLETSRAILLSLRLSSLDTGLVAQ